MTAVVPPLRLPTLAEARDQRVRVLPGPSDTAGWTAAKVAEIAGVDLPAHALAHPGPQHGCQLCPPPARLWRDPASEQTWREDAARPPVRSEVNR